MIEDKWVDWDVFENLQAQELAAEESGSTKIYKVFPETNSGAGWESIDGKERALPIAKRKRSMDASGESFDEENQHVHPEELGTTRPSGGPEDGAKQGRRKRKRGWDPEPEQKSPKAAKLLRSPKKQEDIDGSEIEMVNEMNAILEGMRATSANNKDNKDNKMGGMGGVTSGGKGDEDIDGVAIDGDDIDGVEIDIEGDEPLDGQDLDPGEYEKLLAIMGR